MKKKNKKEKSNFLKNIKKMWKYIKDSKFYLLGHVFVTIAGAVLGAISPLYVSKVILNLTDGVVNQLIVSAAFVLIIDLAFYIVSFFQAFFWQKIYQKTLINLQFDVAKETLKLEIKEIDKANSGVFIDRLNKDTQDISGLFMEYSYWFSYVISNVGVLIGILVLSKYMFIYAVITSVGIFFINRKRISKQYEVNRNWRKIQERKTGLIGELVRGIRDVKVLNATDTILKQTKGKIVEAANEEINMMNIRRIYVYVESNLRSISDFILIVLGCILYNKNLLSIPTFVIIYNYQGRVKNLLTGIVQILEYNKKFVVSSDRIFEIIDNKKFRKEKFGSTSVDKLNGDIKFKRVKFGYNKNKPIVKNLSFEIKPNEKVAFVGKSGAGKTTIFGLITKLYTIDSGKILLDGHNLYDLDESSIRDNMSIITQSPYIFNFTIKENLLLAKEDASMEEIREACRLACIDDYIMSLPKKYNTLVGENGVILSGGQKQRLAIARALLMKTEIILFDEATSALDNETQSEIQRAIDNLTGEYTILIVAHRLSTVIDCDRIFVVDDGKILDSGSHKELLKKCEFYRNLYEKDLEN